MIANDDDVPVQTQTQTQTHTHDVDVTCQFIDDHAFWNTKRIEADLISNSFDLAWAWVCVMCV